MSPYVYQALGIVGSAVTIAGGAWAYRRRVLVDVEAKKANLALETQSLPLQLLKDELAKREAELATMREQDRAERQQYIETLTAMKTALETIAKDLTAHREEEKARAAGVHAKLDGVDKRLLVLEIQGGQKPPTIPSAPAGAS